MACIRKEKGFLLIEVVIAMVIISIALVSATGMFIQATKANSEAEQYTTATTLAQEQLERLKQWKHSDWASLSAGDIPRQGTGTVANPVTVNNIAYTITTITETADDPARLVQVKVTVSWSNETKKVEMTAVYPKIPLPI